MRGSVLTNIGDVKFNIAWVNNLGAAVDPTVNDDSTFGYQVGSTWINTTGGKAFVCYDATDGAAVWVQDANSDGKPVEGVAAGYKVARGVHQQAAASDTIVTGLATVVSVVASWRDTPTVKQMFLTASIGNQSGAPAAGSFLSKTFKPTAVDDVTPIPATDFTDSLSFDWIAIGT